jgi:hypothetical protein
LFSSIGVSGTVDCRTKRRKTERGVLFFFRIPLETLLLAWLPSFLVEIVDFNQEGADGPAQRNGKKEGEERNREKDRFREEKGRR